MVGINIVGLMMLVRIYALYNRELRIVAGVATLLLVEIGMYAWLMTTGVPVQHVASTSCTMIFGESNKIASSASAWLPLLYDTVVLVLTLKRTIPSARRNSRDSTMHLTNRLLEDGLIYYSAIFAVTLVLTVMIVAAPPGLKNITAQLELLITVTMMSRITLNLMKSHDHHLRHLLSPENPKIHYQATPDFQFPSPRSRETQSPPLRSPATSKGKDRDRFGSLSSSVEFADLNSPVNNEGKITSYPPRIFQ
jgi:hypothetical protein